MAKPHEIWNRHALRCPHHAPDKHQRIHAMFQAIAPRYDLLNRLLSLGQDQRWRRHAVARAAPAPGESVLDLCCGSGDLTYALAQAQPDLDLLVGVDFAPAMLDLARAKAPCPHPPAATAHSKPLQIQWLCADAARLPFPHNSFDLITCAFGLRNLQYPNDTLRQLAKLLRPPGRITILEFHLPKKPLTRAFAHAYFRLVLPLCGSIISCDRTRAYHYLPRSVLTFDTAQTLTQGLLNAGFLDIRCDILSAGAVLCLNARIS